MVSRDRIRLVVLFGGKSAEHEVSCISALHVLRAVDRDRYDTVPIGITRDGRWVDARDAVAALTGGESVRALPSPDDTDAAELDPMPSLVPVDTDPDQVVVFPLLHG